MSESRGQMPPSWVDVETVLKVGGTAGASIGIIHHGEILTTRSFGFQDVELKAPSASSTLYPLGSLSKLFVSTTCAQMVDEGLLDWSANISQYLPDYRPKSQPQLADSLRLTDLLSHSAGFARKDALWLGSNNVVLVDKQHLIEVCNDLKSIAQPREKWIYNNFLYGLVGEIIERTTGQTWGTVLETRLLKKVGMDSTTVKEPELDRSRLALPYIVGEDGKLYRVGGVDMLEGSALSPAGGVHSNVDDILKLMLELLRGLREFSSTLANVGKVFSGHSILAGQSGYDELYALGLAKVTTPATFGKMGFNVHLVDKMPILGEDSGSKLVFYHNGAIPGYNHCLMIIPETQTAIVVLTNSMSRGDTADWIAQILLQDILQLKPSLSVVSVAEEAAKKWNGRYLVMKEKLESQRIPNTKAPQLQDLVGVYVHTTGALRLQVSEDEDKLRFQINNLESQSHQLRHYHHDTFTFFPSAEERNRRGMVQYAVDAWLLEFRTDDDGKFVEVKWILDKDVPEGEIFSRTSQ